MKKMSLLLSGLAAFAAAGFGYSEIASRRFEKSAPPLGQFVDVDGGRVHLLDMGPAESELAPVVLIHGASVNLRDMKIALGDTLAKERRVIAVDRPGHGYSTRPGDGWRLEVQAKMIAEAVASRGVEHPIIVGQSFGGAVALAYGVHHADKASGLVLLAPVSHRWEGGVAWYNEVSGKPAIGALLRRLVIPVYGPISARDGYADSFAPNDPPPDYVSQAGLPLLFRPASFERNAQDMVALKAEVTAQQPLYQQIQLPVEIASGIQDTAVNPDIHAKKLAQEIPSAELTLWENTGHALHHARDSDVVSLIRRIDTRSR